jgi:hypothetical protein
LTAFLVPWSAFKIKALYYADQSLEHCLFVRFQAERQSILEQLFFYYRAIVPRMFNSAKGTRQRIQEKNRLSTVLPEKSVFPLPVSPG